MCEDIMLDWSCEALAFQMSRPNFSFLCPVPSPPAHYPLFPKPQIGSCHGSTTVSTCHGGAKGQYDAK